VQVLARGLGATVPRAQGWQAAAAEEPWDVPGAQSTHSSDVVLSMRPGDVTQAETPT
jgi:hypothetical protein